MRPATQDDLNDFINRQPVLILDKDGIGPAYVEYLVRQSTSSVTSKEHCLYLPLELWFDILEYCHMEPNYCLVIPKRIEDSGTQGSNLVLQRPKFRSKCGDIWDFPQLFAYEEVLNGSQRIALGPRHTTHRLFQAYGARDPDRRIVRFDPRYFRLDRPILFTDLSVQDVISKAEGGACGRCGNSRAVNSSFSWDSWEQQVLFPGLLRARKIPCGLCIGEIHAFRDQAHHFARELERRCAALGYGYQVFAECGLPLPSPGDHRDP